MEFCYGKTTGNRSVITHDSSVVAKLMQLIESRGISFGSESFFSNHNQRLLASKADKQFTRKRNRTKDLVLDT